MIYDIKQFKLNSGQEIVCEIIEWPVAPHVEIIVRNCMQISPATAPSNGQKYYVFNTWMHYVEGNDDLVVISSDHIVATVTPNHLLRNQYLRAVYDMHENFIDREAKYKEEERQLMTIAQALSAAGVDKIKKGVRPEEDDSDGGSNIIKFPKLTK